MCPISTAPSVERPSELKVIGIGSRGISAMKRLHSVKSDSEAELWAIDSDRRLLSSCQDIQQIEVQPSDDSILSPEDLRRLCASLSPSSHEGPEGPQHGVAFVLGSSLGSPGGSHLMLQVVNQLRRNGFFVCVALTRPFSFEGPRKLEQADTLIEAMEDIASLVVTIDQNVLVRASSELTMPEASRIADNTLEYTVKTMLWALRAPEILKATQGGSFVWHGRDLRLMKRALFPPMMTLVSCPGVGSLGRGLASIPISSVAEAGLPSTLSTLAEDAVRAASESPFLEGRVEGRCTAALCVLLLPRSLLTAKDLNDLLASATNQQATTTTVKAGSVSDNQREFALRSAVQVAAMTVQEMAGPQCTDIIICPQLKDDEGASSSSSSSSSSSQDASILTIECSLLALEAIEEAVLPPATSGLLKGNSNSAERGQGGKATIRSPLGGSLSLPTPPPPVDSSPKSRLDLNSGPSLRQQRQSMLIQNSISDLKEFEKRGSPASPPPDSPSPSPQDNQANAASPSPSSTAATVKKPSKSHWNAMSMIAGGSAQGLSEAQKQRLAARQIPQGGGNIQSKPAPLTPPVIMTKEISAGSPKPPAPPTQPSWNIDQQPLAQIPRLAERLTTSLVAQSLDLPPRAAKWRHQQRVNLAAASSQILKSIPNQIYNLTNLPSLFPRGGSEEEGADEDLVEDKKVDVKTRGLKMLQSERE